MEANSSPMYPPPTIASRRGNSFSSMIDALVWRKRLADSPSIGGRTVSAPVSIKMYFAFSTCLPSAPSTETSSGETNEPTPV